MKLNSIFSITVILTFGSLHSFGQNTSNQLALKAESLENPSIRYVSGYVSIAYPMGDVPPETGVCTDVVIRAFRLLDLDLQKEVHEDMKAHFSEYPKNWGLTSTDRNIDHRRVPNLMKFFERSGWQKSITNSALDYIPGDIVAWDLGGGITHIGIVTTKKANAERYLIIHNIGKGQVLEDILFTYTIIGHYRKP